MKKVYSFSIAALCVIGIIVICYGCFCCRSTTVILVRHAEKLTSPSSNDPPLSPEGIERASALAHTVEHAGIDVIFASDALRTQQTVQPTAVNLGLTTRIVNAGNTEALIDSVRAHKGQEILIAGHSNTVPLIIERLGISQPPQIAENDYDNFFIIYKRCCVFRCVKMIHLTYGNPSP